MDRRTVVTLLGAGLVSAGGCLGLESESTATQEATSSPSTETEVTAAMGSRDYADVKFDNHTSEALTVTLRATANGEDVVEKTLSVPVGDTAQPERTYEEFSGRRTLTVHVAVEDGPTGNHEFDDSKTDAQSLYVHLYPDSIEFQLAVA